MDRGRQEAKVALVIGGVRAGESSGSSRNARTSSSCSGCAQESCEQSPALEHPVPPGLPLESTPDLQQSGPSQTLAMGGRPVMQMPQFMANDPRTSMFSTAMLRNIPNRYTRKMLVDRLDDGFRGGFDFVYMPIDFSKQCNMGYAFINFKDPLTCRRFMRTFHGVRSKDCLLSCNSPKVCEACLSAHAVVLLRGRKGRLSHVARRDDCVSMQ